MNNEQRESESDAARKERMLIEAARLQNVRLEPLYGTTRDCARADSIQIDGPQRERLLIKEALGNVPNAPSGTPVEPGTYIGRYRIERLLGEGSFGRVYLAYDEQLERWVALKVPRDTLVSRPDQAATYLGEARILASLDHPHIVSVFDVGRTEEGLCFMASKFIEGVELKRQISDGMLSPVEAARILVAVAEALHHVHLRGLVHRDIKPANILIQRTGEPCVVDFGLALHEDRQSLHRGEISGTLAYMAPEQVRGESHLLDGRTDIWALGVVLYELLTGRRPFRGKTAAELIEQIERREPKPCRMIDDCIPRELEQICLKCLQKPVIHRYATARDLAESLRNTIGRLESAVLPSNPSESELANSLERACDDNVQFTVYRPRLVQPDRWYPLLAFAHLAEKPEDAPPDDPDPIEEVQRQVDRVLGDASDDYSGVRQDSGEPIPREGELTFVPAAQGVEFNPPRRTFVWREAVHREEFRLRATATQQGKRVRGRMSVFLGSILIAEIQLTFLIDAVAPAEPELTTDEVVAARRFRRIYPAFAENDRFVVQHLESYARLLGDEYLTQCQTLRSQGKLKKELQELMRGADVFQLFWSSHALKSRLVQDEYQFALSLGRENWIRPVYWETPLPSDPARGIPPDELQRLGFQQLSAPTNLARPTDTQYRDVPPVCRPVPTADSNPVDDDSFSDTKSDLIVEKAEVAIGDSSPGPVPVSESEPLLEEMRKVAKVVRSLINECLSAAPEQSEVQHKLDKVGKSPQVFKNQVGALEYIVQCVSQSVERGDHPAIFLLVGPNDVGQTEAVERIARQLYGGDGFLTTIDLSNYQEEHKASDLFGSRRGYVGGGQKGALTEPIRQMPNSVVLLDEIEKAHPSVQQLIFDACKNREMIDGNGQKIDCQNVIFLLKSNLGQQAIKENADHPDLLLEKLHTELARFFEEKFLQNIEVVPFLSIGKEEFKRIIQLKLDAVKSRILSNHSVDVEFDDRIMDEILSVLLPPEHGLRMVDAFIEQQMLPKLAKELLHRLHVKEYIHRIYMTVSEGEFVVQVE